MNQMHKSLLLPSMLAQHNWGQQLQSWLLQTDVYATKDTPHVKNISFLKSLISFYSINQATTLSYKNKI